MLTAIFVSSALTRLIRRNGGSFSQTPCVETLVHVAGARIGLADQHHVGLEHVADDVAERDELGAVAEAEVVADAAAGGALERRHGAPLRMSPGITVLADDHDVVRVAARRARARPRRAPRAHTRS